MTRTLDPSWAEFGSGISAFARDGNPTSNLFLKKYAID
jgi:hypothetical protein